MARKEFTAKSGLGFMRFIQFLNIMNISLFLFITLFISTLTYDKSYNLMLFNSVVLMLGQAVVFWLIAKRKMYTRQIAIGFYVLDALLSIVSSASLGQLSAEAAITSCVLPCLMALYFLTSRRAKAVLVQPFDTRIRDKSLAEGRIMWNPRSLDFWMRLLIYFFLFSVAGHWMEMGLQILIINGLFPGTVAGQDSLTWRDSWNPFFIYGIAVAFCGLALFPLWQWLLKKMPQPWMAFAVSFFANGFFCVAAELVLGLLFNQDLSAWDYSDQFMNFQGQICLLYSVAFAVVSSLITWVLYPAMEKQFSYLSKDMFRLLFVLSAVLFVFLYTTYNVDLVRLGQTDESHTVFTANQAAEAQNTSGN